MSIKSVSVAKTIVMEIGAMNLIETVTDISQNLSDVNRYQRYVVLCS